MFLKIHSDNDLKKYIKLELKLLKTGMILAFISVNDIGYHNIRTH